MAASEQGRRLTEQHRLAQLRIRSRFLTDFLALWHLLDSRRLDETGPGWVEAALRLIRVFRAESAVAATDYYHEFQSVEAPITAPRPRVQLELPSPRPEPSRPLNPEPPRRRSDTARRARLNIDDSVFRRPLEPRRARIEVPNIDWKPADRAVRVSLTVTGPVAQKAKVKRGKLVEVARDESLVQASGAASRHVLTGGRRSLLTLLEEDPQVLGWARVTDGDPCAFCAMLASRGVVFRSKESASFQAHDHCACTAEPVYSRDAPLPGRGAEFQQLWSDHIKGQYSGKEARNAWRRLYEQRQRDARREQVA